MSQQTTELVQAIHRCLGWAVDWEPSDQQPTFDPTAAEAFQRVVALLEGGARMTHDTPFSGDQGLLESISWNSYCIWGDDDATHRMGEQYDHACQAVLVELVKRGFRFPNGEADLVEFAGTKGFDAQGLVALSKAMAQEQLERVLPETGAKPMRPRM